MFLDRTVDLNKKNIYKYINNENIKIIQIGKCNKHYPLLVHVSCVWCQAAGCHTLDLHGRAERIHC